MKNSFKWALGIVSIITVAFISACATAGQGTLPSGGAMTMSSIYAAQTNTASSNMQSTNELRHQIEVPASAEIMQTGFNESNTTQLFQLLPNPAIALHVYPHWVMNGDESLPVPGYTTAFFLYKENHFALPDEMYPDEMY